MTPGRIRIEFVQGRPVLVIAGPSAQRALWEVLDRVVRTQIYAGTTPNPDLIDIANESRRAHAINQLVPQTEPAHGESPQPRARWITTDEASRHFGITPRAVRKRIATGRLAARREAGRWFIDTKELTNEAA